MTILPDTPPPGWGDDELTDFFDTARNNQYATFNNMPIGRRLVRIDALFMRAVKDAHDPKPRWPILFLVRAHSNWRAATALAMSGAAHEAMPLLRSALEQAAYGAHIGEDEERLKIWMARHDGKAQLDKMVEEFKNWRLRKTIAALAPKLESDFVKLYDTAIDMGGHPNMMGFFSSLEMHKTDDARLFQNVYLHDSGQAHDLALLSWRRVGMWILSQYGIVYTARFQLLGIHDELAELRKEHAGDPKGRNR